MRFRTQLTILAIYFIGTVILIVNKQDNQELANLWIPIYYMIGLLMYFIGEYAGKTRFDNLK